MSAGRPQGRGSDDAIVIEAQTQRDGIALENRALGDLLASIGQPWRKERQILARHAERQYDVFTVRFADDTVREVWFDITSLSGGFGISLFGPARAESQQHTLPPFPHDTEDDVAEAVVRHQMRTFRGEVAFLIYHHPGEEDTDPSDTFLARFAGHHPPVRKKSDSTMAVPSEEVPRRSLWQRLFRKAPPPAPERSFFDSRPQIVDRTTGKTGTKFRIGAIKRLADDRADVEGGWYAGGQAAWDGVYHLRHEGDRWIVYDETMIARL